VVRLNEPTSIGGDDPEKIHYQKIEYKDNREKTTQSPKSQHTQISLSHKRELTTKREKLSFFPMPLAATKERKEIWTKIIGCIF
jgi:hypothetical protein